MPVSSATNIAAENEPWTCKYCGRINLMSRKPFSRREKKVRVMKLDDIFWKKLLRFKTGFPNMEAALSYLMFKAESMEDEEYKELDTIHGDRFKGIIVDGIKE
jgi:hypothetical protein